MEATVAIVGSGPAATAVAHLCARRGIDVVVFEKGPTHYRHPFIEGFTRQQLALLPPTTVPEDLQNLEQAGTYRGDLNHERRMIIGGAGTVWGGLTPRMFPSDFQTRSRLAYGHDWPITYDELEPYYGKAEAFLGVSGTDLDNPFAPPRSNPFPLPPFELGFYDRILADRARRRGLVIHTSQQARARLPYDGRGQCANFGVCWVCPTGAMYAPNHHLQQAAATGNCTIRADTSVRRIVVKGGRARGVVIQHNDGSKEVELAAKYVVVAGGVFESVRLLLLSANSANPDGLGNASGHLGRHAMLKRIWRAHLHFKHKMFPDRIPFTGQSQQFVDNETRGRHGGLRINFSGNLHDPALEVEPPPRERPREAEKRPVEELVAPKKIMANCVRCAIQGESTPNDQSFIALADQKDRFGDPFAKVTITSSDFDRATYEYAKKLLVDMIVPAVAADDYQLPAFDSWATGHHHFGGCRSASSVGDGVVDAFGEVHGTSNLFVIGSSTFVTQSCNNPTLTIVALAIRTAEMIAERAGIPSR